MPAPAPRLFLGGLRLLLANKRTLLWSYLALLAAGLVTGASTHARFGFFLDHSLAAQKLAGSIDLGYFLELLQHAYEHDPGNGPVTSALTFVSILLSFFFAAGILHVFLTGEKPRLATMLRAGIEYFWRFFRLTLFAAIIAGPVLGLLGWLRSVYLKQADEKFVEAAYDWRYLLTLALLLLVALTLRMWFDLAEVYVVRLGQEGDRRVRRTLGPSLRLLRMHFGHLFLGYFAAGALGVLAASLFLSIWLLNQTSLLVVPVFLWSQIGLLCLLASRIWERGIVATLVMAAEPTQTVVLIEPGPPEPAPLIPIEGPILPGPEIEPKLGSELEPEFRPGLEPEGGISAPPPPLAEPAP